MTHVELLLLLVSGEGYLSTVVNGAGFRSGEMTCLHPRIKARGGADAQRRAAQAPHSSWRFAVPAAINIALLALSGEPQGAILCGSPRLVRRLRRATRFSSLPPELGAAQHHQLHLLATARDDYCASWI